MPQTPAALAPRSGPTESSCLAMTSAPLLASVSAAWVDCGGLYQLLVSTTRVLMAGSSDFAPCADPLMPATTEGIENAETKPSVCDLLIDAATMPVRYRTSHWLAYTLETFAGRSSFWAHGPVTTKSTSGFCLATCATKG